MSWKKYGGTNKLETLNNLTVNSIVTDNLSLRKYYLGDWDICGGLRVKDNAIIYKDTDLCGNLVVGKDTSLLGEFTVAKDTNLFGNLVVLNDAYFSQNLYFDPSGNTLLHVINGGFGFNKYNPLATIDISSDRIQTVYMKTSTIENRNVYAQNVNSQGIVAGVDSGNAYINMFVDQSMTGSGTGAFDGQLRYASDGHFYIDVSNVMNVRPRTVFGANIAKPMNSDADRVVIYDTPVVSYPYLKDVYIDGTFKTGTSLALIAQETFPSDSNVFMRMTTETGNGFTVGGGAFEGGMMGVLALTDGTDKYPAMNIFSGDLDKYLKTSIGVNKHRVSKTASGSNRYLLDVNGPTKMIHQELLMSYDVSMQIFAMEFCKEDAQIGYAIGSPYNAILTPENLTYERYFLKTTDGGYTWTRSRILMESTGLPDANLESGTSTFFAIYVFSVDYVVIGGFGGFLYYTNNGGIRWSQAQYNGISNFTINSTYANFNGSRTIFGLNTGDFIDTAAFANSNNVLRILIDSTTPPVNKYPSGLSAVISIDGSNNFVYMVGIGGIQGYMLGTDGVINAGARFFTGSTFSDVSVFHGADSKYHSVAVGTNGSNCLIRYVHASSITSSWSTPVSVIAGSLNSVHVFSETHAIAVGNNGLVIYSDDGFVTWKKISHTELDAMGNGSVISGLNLSNIYAVNGLENKQDFAIVGDVQNFSGGVRQGRAKVFSFYAPYFFNRAHNFVLEASGSILLSGDLRINDNGNVFTNSNSISLFPDVATEINIGNTAIGGNTNVKHNLDVVFNAHIYQKLIVDSYSFLNDDVSLNGKLYVTKDASLNSNLFVGRDASFGSKLYVVDDASLNSNLFVGRDASFGSKLYLVGDASFNSRLFVGDDVSMGADLYLVGDASFNSRLFVGGDVSLNSNLYLVDDASFNSRLFVGGDVSLNSNLYLVDDASFNSRLFVGKDVSLGSKLYVVDDASLNSRLFVGKDVSLGSKLYVVDDASFNSRMFVGGDVSLGSKLYVVDDASLNSRLYVGKDVSLGSKLYVVDDASLNSRLYVGGDVSLGSKLYVVDDASLNSRLYVGGDVSLNSNLYVVRDASLNSRLYVGGDVSLNSNLYVVDDASFNSRLFVGRDASFGSKLYLVGDASLNSRLYVGGDVSLGSKLHVVDDASFNSRLFVGSDVSMGSKLYVVDDVSLNSRLFVGRDVSLGSKLYVVDDVSMNSRLFVGQDVSLNANLYVVNDVSFNSRLFVGQDVSLNANLYVVKDASLNSRLFVGGDVSLGSKLYVVDDASLNRRLFVGKDVSFGSKLYVVDDVSMNSRLYVGNNVSFDAKLRVADKSTFESDVSINANLFVIDVSARHLDLRGTRNSDGVGSGALIVQGGASIGKDLNVGGNLYINNYLDVVDGTDHIHFGYTNTRKMYIGSSDFTDEIRIGTSISGVRDEDVDIYIGSNTHSRIHILGNLLLPGYVTFENQTNLEIVNKTILLNDQALPGSSYGAGIYIREDGSDTAGQILVNPGMTGFFLKAPRSTNIVNFETNGMTLPAGLGRGILTIVPSTNSDGSNYTVAHGNVFISDIQMLDASLNNRVMRNPVTTATQVNTQVIDGQLSMTGLYVNKLEATVFDNAQVDIAGNAIVSRMGLGSSVVRPAYVLDVSGDTFSNGAILQW